MRDRPTALTRSLTVRPWPDPLVDDLGHDPRSEYVERYWLGILGPTATFLLRRLAARLEEAPEGFELDLDATAAELGVPGRGGLHSPFHRTLGRCARFGCTELLSADTMRVRRKLPPLTASQVGQLPDHLQARHRQADPAGVATPPDRLPHEVRERARGFALSLLHQGLAAGDVERELHRRALHPALAHDTVTWALAHRPSEA